MELKATNFSPKVKEVSKQLLEFSFGFAKMIHEGGGMLDVPKISS